MYPGTRFQGKSPPRREADGHGRVEMSPRDRAHEQNDGHHHDARSYDGRDATYLPEAHRVHHARPCGDDDEEERPEKLAKQPPPLQPRIVEVFPGELGSHRNGSVIQGGVQVVKRRSGGELALRFVPASGEETLTNQNTLALKVQEIATSYSKEGLL